MMKQDKSQREQQIYTEKKKKKKQRIGKQIAENQMNKLRRRKKKTIGLRLKRDEDSGSVGEIDRKKVSDASESEGRKQYGRNLSHGLGGTPVVLENHKLAGVSKRSVLLHNPH